MTVKKYVRMRLKQDPITFLPIEKQAEQQEEEIQTWHCRDCSKLHGVDVYHKLDEACNYVQAAEYLACLYDVH